MWVGMVDLSSMQINPSNPWENILIQIPKLGTFDLESGEIWDKATKVVWKVVAKHGLYKLRALSDSDWSFHFDHLYMWMPCGGPFVDCLAMWATARVGPYIPMWPYTNQVSEFILLLADDCSRFTWLLIERRNPKMVEMVRMMWMLCRGPFGFIWWKDC